MGTDQKLTELELLVLLYNRRLEGELLFRDLIQHFHQIGRTGKDQPHFAVQSNRKVYSFTIAFLGIPGSG